MDNSQNSVNKHVVQDDENAGKPGVDESSAYYYDDSTGYEVYDDDANDEPENEDEDRSSDS
jgi:hypothetical protein